eukprot:scaffold260458_cov18-Tisochrysis_lutea.AAC.1
MICMHLKEDPLRRNQSKQRQTQAGRAKCAHKGKQKIEKAVFWPSLRFLSPNNHQALQPIIIDAHHMCCPGCQPMCWRQTKQYTHPCVSERILLI